MKDFSQKCLQIQNKHISLHSLLKGGNVGRGKHQPLVAVAA